MSYSARLRAQARGLSELEALTDDHWSALVRALLTRRHREDFDPRTGSETEGAEAILRARSRLLFALARPGSEDLAALGLDGLARALGRRATPTTIAGPAGLPPPRRRLLEAAAALNSGGLSAAARARDKHAARGGSSRWSPARGSAEKKNREAAALIADLIAGAADWNSYRHGALGPVFELRLPDGHGARWSADGARFIGLIEPFAPP